MHTLYLIKELICYQYPILLHKIFPKQLNKFTCSIILFYKSTTAVEGMHQTLRGVYVIHQFPAQFQGQI